MPVNSRRIVLDALQMTNSQFPMTNQAPMTNAAKVPGRLLGSTWTFSRLVID
jgi:hypothetical protein